MNFLSAITSQSSPQPKQNPQSQSSSPLDLKKQQKLRLSAKQSEHESDDLDTNLLIKAINNSFIQRMSGSEEKLDPNNLIAILAQFALSESQKLHKKQDLTIRQWCVVEIDEQYLKNKGIGTLGGQSNPLLSACSHGTTNEQRHEYNIINHIELPSSIRPYCLVLNMNSRELHFQSHQEASNHFFINLDTIPVTIQEQKINNFGVDVMINWHPSTIQEYLNKPIVLNIEQKNNELSLRIYVTAFTLPFPFIQTSSQIDKNRYLISCRQSLYNLLNNSIQASRGRQLKLNKIVQQALKNSTKFYNTRYATEEQFTKYCQSGDLLLFRDAHTMAKIQRAITNSPYDHVAIVFRSEQYGICLFQSNSGLGVGLAPWRSLIRKHWFEGIEKISWRKLQMDKTPENFQQKVDQFIKGNLHKEFGLSLPKLLKFKSITYSKNSNKSYFCSELAAELYRFLGLLDGEKSSTQYWPKDFADGNGLQILNGALDPERELVFQDAILRESYPGYQPSK